MQMQMFRLRACQPATGVLRCQCWTKAHAKPHLERGQDLLGASDGVGGEHVLHLGVVQQEGRGAKGQHLQREGGDVESR